MFRLLRHESAIYVTTMTCTVFFYLWKLHVFEGLLDAEVCQEFCVAREKGSPVRLCATAMPYIVNVHVRALSCAAMAVLAATAIVKETE